MAFAELKNKVTSMAGRQLLVAQKHSPVVLTGLAAVGVVGTAVLAVRATLKLEDVLKKDEAETAAVEGDQEATFQVKVNTAWKVAKLYAPAATCGVFTVGALTGSTFILNRRNAGLTAAYTVMHQGYQEYRNRVIAELGKDADRKFRLGAEEKIVGDEREDGTVEDKVVMTVEPSKAKRSPYVFIFERDTSVHWKPEYGHNQMFLRTKQDWATNMLRSRGHLTLNEVLTMLGMEETAEGLVLGWVKGEGDDFVDFGVCNDPYEGKRFLDGHTRDVVLDFNCIGSIMDKLGKRK